MKTIRARLLVMLLSGLTLVLVAGGIAIYLIEQSNLLNQFDAGLENRAHSIASLVKQEPVGTIWEFGDAPQTLLAETYFEIKIHSGNVVKRSVNLGTSTLPTHDPDEGVLVYQDVDLPGNLQGRAAWYTFRPRMDEDDWVGRDVSVVTPPLLVVVTGLNREPVDQALATLRGALWLVGGAVGVTAMLLVLFGTRWGLAPLHRLSWQLGDVEGSTISQRFEADQVPGELAPIYRELNAMLDRVEKTIERERSFANAAAHELRTPLTELRTTAEVAIKWPSEQRAVNSLRELLAIGREMERLVESLLLISRGDAVEILKETEEVPLVSIVQHCLDRTNGSILDHSLNLRIELDERNTLRGTVDTVEIIVRNLIDNAVRYTPIRGSIRIGNGCVVNGSNTLLIENGPVNLGEDNLARLFDPFWQLQRSRSDRTHFGLGLAVVRQVAQTIGLNVEARLEGDHLQILVTPKG